MMDPGRQETQAKVHRRRAAVSLAIMIDLSDNKWKYELESVNQEHSIYYNYYMYHCNSAFELFTIIYKFK